ncbi:site-specific integrase [Nocardioides sp.]|uniref:site-specific integrase n=1 Tax=Nocardioides sp. TaxID=35761 RepID=UPI002BF1D3EA|nr:tyrosine-type recombinase/integrase [Nocardioides sp.]HXH81109.1 tyrosine-type recombinase/integrase [Nocardioides sp.]
MVAHWDVNETTRADVQELLYGNLFRRNQRGEYIFDEDGSRIPLKGPQPRQVLRLLLGFAADFGHRRDGMNPLAGTRKPTASPRNPRLLRALTPEEWQELLEMARTAALRPRAAPHLYVALAIMYYTGVRIGEALGLTVDKVDLRSDPPTIVFDEKLPESFRVGQRQLLEMTKSQDQRVVVVVPQLAEILANVLARLDYTRAGDPLIVTKRGTFVTHANVRTTLRALVAGTALEWMHPHALRRTYLTAAERVYGLAGAADLGGHLDERVTQRHYVIIEGVKVLDPRAMFVEVPADADAEARRPRLRAVD